MKYLIVLLCLIAITFAALDVRCGAVAAGADTVIVACRAGRLNK